MFRVDDAICTGCGDCVDVCPAGAISLVHGKAQIDAAACIDCGSCADACPRGAIVAAGIADPAYISGRPGVSVSAIVPAKIESRRPEVEIAPAALRRSQFWPMVGSALVWAAHELLPEVIAAWRTSRAGVSQATDFGLIATNRRPSTNRRGGHRHRRGRARRGSPASRSPV